MFVNTASPVPMSSNVMAYYVMSRLIVSVVLQQCSSLLCHLAYVEVNEEVGIVTNYLNVKVKGSTYLFISGLNR